MFSINPDELKPDTLLSNDQGAAALTAKGYRTSPATLNTKRTRGGGPQFQKYGSRVLYRWGDLLDWACSRLSEPVASTSELARNRHSGREERHHSIETARA